MKLKTLFIVFEGLTFGGKIKILLKIADTSFNGYNLSTIFAKKLHFRCLTSF